MADFATIKALVVTKVQGVTDKLAAAAVFNHEPALDAVTHDPFAVVIASGNENDWATSNENRRSYAFTIRLFMERKSRGEQNAEEALIALVDDLLDDFDQDPYLGGAVLISRAVPSRWGYVQGVKEFRYAEISVLAKTDFSIS